MRSLLCVATNCRSLRAATRWLPFWRVEAKGQLLGGVVARTLRRSGARELAQGHRGTKPVRFTCWPRVSCSRVALGPPARARYASSSRSFASGFIR